MKHPGGRAATPSCIALVATLFCAQTLAAPTGYTNRATFEATANALGGTAATFDFDSLIDGTALVSGVNQGGVTFVYNLGGVQIEVRQVIDAATFDTPSLPNYAGSDDAGVLQDGDNFDLVFDGFVNAVGLSFTSADAMAANDIVLSANGLGIGLDPAAVQAVLDDDANEYFLGIVDDSLAFSTAAITTVGGGFFLYALDDLEAATAPDADNDAVADSADNCLLKPNPGQVDTDGDAIGNACDPDFDQNCFIDFVDLGFMKANFFSGNADADLDGSGFVDFLDLGIMKAFFFGPPGPSGLPNPCGGP